MGNNKKKSDSGNFLVQGSILAAAGIIVRFIGLLYKIPMTRAIGDEGIGYYNTAYEIYNIGLILSSYSLPLAISKPAVSALCHERCFLFFQTLQCLFCLCLPLFLCSNHRG